MFIWAAYLIFKDRHDWFKYIIVFLAAGFLFATTFGVTVLETVQIGTAWIDTQLGNLFQRSR